MNKHAILHISLGAALAALMALSPAHAEMLQFSTPDGTKSWPKLPDIPDWHQDQESSLRLSANSMIPDGTEFATAETTIQARGIPQRGSAGTTTLSQLVDSDRAAAAGAHSEKLADIADKDGNMFQVYAFAPANGNAGMWKVTAYSEEGDYLLAFTLSARSQAAYDAALPVFDGLVQHYAQDIPW